MVLESEQGICTLSDYIAENGAMSENQARWESALYILYMTRYLIA